MSFRSTKTAAAKRRAAVEYLPASEVQSRCSAAARMVARGAEWSPEDRADIAAEVFCKVWRKAKESPHSEAPGISSVPTMHLPSSVAHGPAVAYSKYSAQKSKDTVTLSAGRVEAMRADLCAWSYLLGLAATERRSMERERERDFQESMRAAEVAPDFSPFIAAPSADVAGNPVQARRSAVEMLRALGMLEPIKRHGRTVLAAPRGPVWTLAYAAARAVESTSADGERGGLDRETVARELELSADACKKHLQRAAAQIPAGKSGHLSRSAWAEALYMPEGGIALKPSRSRTMSTDIGTRATGPRDYLKPKDQAPVNVRSSARIKRVPTAWERGPHARPAWTRDLQPKTANRLAAAARWRQGGKDRAAAAAQ